MKAIFNNDGSITDLKFATGDQFQYIINEIRFEYCHRVYRSKYPSMIYKSKHPSMREIYRQCQITIKLIRGFNYPELENHIRLLNLIGSFSLMRIKK